MGALNRHEGKENIVQIFMLTHWGCLIHIRFGEVGHHWVRHLTGAKSSPEPMLTLSIRPSGTYLNGMPFENEKLSFKKNVFENVICRKLAILPWPCFVNAIFLHNRPWILRWIKSISNEFNFIINMITLHLSGHCDVISKPLWHHQQNENWASETQGRCVKLVVFIVMYGFFMLCKK